MDSSQDVELDAPVSPETDGLIGLAHSFSYGYCTTKRDLYYKARFAAPPRRCAERLRLSGRGATHLSSLSRLRLAGGGAASHPKEIKRGAPGKAEPFRTADGIAAVPGLGVRITMASKDAFAGRIHPGTP